MDRFLELLNKWISPFTITAVIGFVIWLVQLNGAILNMTEKTTMLESHHVALESDVQSTAVLLSRTSAIQDALISQIEALEKRIERNEGLIYNNQNHK